MAAGAWVWFLNISAINYSVWWLFYPTMKWQNTQGMSSTVCSETLKNTGGNSKCDEQLSSLFTAFCKKDGTRRRFSLNQEILKKLVKIRAPL
jgi:hypothetical protein